MRAVLPLFAALLLGGCTVTHDVESRETVVTSDTTYVIQEVLKVGPGSGSWAGQVDASAAEPSFFVSIKARLETGALDALFVAVPDQTEIRAWGNLFYDLSAQQSGSGGTWFDYTIVGSANFTKGSRTILVVWSGLESPATVRLGLQEGAVFSTKGSEANAVGFTPMSMGDDGNPILHSGMLSHRREGTTLFWGDLSISRLGRGDLKVTAEGSTFAEHVEGPAAPSVQRFAGIWGPTEIQVEYDLTGVGDNPGLYGVLVRIPDFVPERGWLRTVVCGICT